MEELTLADLLRQAINREIDSQRVYRDLASRVQLPAARYAISLLAEDEERHQKILERYLNGGLTEGTLDIRRMVDYRLAEHFKLSDAGASITLPDIFLLAANREKESHEFYDGLAAIHPEGVTRQLMLKLSLEELGHKQKVESMYTEVAFPQTDGG